MRVGDGQNFRGLGKVANQIDHGAMAGGGGRTERKAKHGTEMVFKLARHRAFDGPVAGIVDARRHLVGEETALVLKKLDGQNTDIFERFEDAAGNVFRRALEWRGKGRGRGGGGGEKGSAVGDFEPGVKKCLTNKRTDRGDQKIWGER